MNKKIRVGLVYGGKSGEHDVSLQTALAVMKAFDYAQYEIIPFYITKQGEWRSGHQLLSPAENREQLMQMESPGEGTSAEALTPLFMNSQPIERLYTGETAISPATSRETAPTASQQGSPAVQPKASELQVDVIFPLLHGTFGEDGTIQGLLEMANIPYVGAGVLASAVGMDKITMKKVFAQEGLPQCMYRHFTRKQWENAQDYFVLEVEVSLGYPCFVKPANLGSSVGISKARNRAELIQAIADAFRYDRKVIVEEYIEAREIEVSVLGNDEPEASVAGEVVSSSEFYDYKAKYVDGKSAMMIPADIPAEKAREAQEMAIRAFLAIDGSGLARVDFFMRKSDGKLLINEINTMPGFTPYSMYPLLWKESGKSYQELLNDLIRLAIQRFEEKQTIDYGFHVE